MENMVDKFQKYKGKNVLITGHTGFKGSWLSQILKYLGARVNRNGILQLHTEESSSQHRNKELSKERFVNLLQEALKVQKKRKPTKPSKSSKKRRLNEKKIRGDLKKLRKKPSEY